MSIFTNQYQSQQDILSNLTTSMKAIMEAPTGYSAPVLASLETTAADSTANQYTDAQAALNNAQSQQNGGTGLPSGASMEADAQLAESAAQTNESQQGQIKLADANLQQQNYLERGQYAFWRVGPDQPAGLRFGRDLRRRHGSQSVAGQYRVGRPGSYEHCGFSGWWRFHRSGCLRQVLDRSLILGLERRTHRVHSPVALGQGSEVVRQVLPPARKEYC